MEDVSAQEASVKAESLLSKETSLQENRKPDEMENGALAASVQESVKAISHLSEEISGQGKEAELQSDESQKSTEEADEIEKSKEKAEEIEKSKEKADEIQKSKEKGDETEKSTEKDDKIEKSKEKGDEIEKSTEKDDNIEKSKEKGDEIEKSKEKDDKIEKSKEKDDKIEKSTEKAEKLEKSEEKDDKTEKSKEDDKIKKTEEKDDKTEKSTEKAEKLEKPEEKDDKTEKSKEKGDETEKSKEKAGEIKKSKEKGDEIGKSEEKGDETEKSEKKAGEIEDDIVGRGDDEYMDVIGNKQLKMKVLKKGQPDSKPTQGNLIEARAKVYLEDGTCVEDTLLNYMMNESDVITAIDMCTALMNDGECAQIITAPRFAYGALGRAPDIPADATLTIDLEILKVLPSPDVKTLPAEELLRFGEKKRQRGNDLFTREEYSLAVGVYSRALLFFEAENKELRGDEPVVQQIKENRIKCYNNMAAAQLKIGASNAVIRSCRIVLSSEPNNVKALYRMGKAFCANGEIDKAIESLKKALKLDPTSKLLHRELALWTQKRKRDMESEKNMYKKMMGSLADAAMDNKKSSNSNWMKVTLLVGGVIAAMFSVGFAYYRTTH